MSKEKLANIYMSTRYNSKISQEAMAEKLGVSRRTIQNWESGVSQPTLEQSTNWFQVLGINPLPYYHRVLFDEFEGLVFTSEDKKVNDALLAIIESLSPSQKRALLYLFDGTHGSDPDSVLEMMLANLHCPMKDRVGIATTIINNYEISESQNTLVDADCIVPNMPRLKHALQNGYEAAKKGNNGYIV